MTKNSRELLNKPVISLYDGIVLGETRGLVFSRKLKKLDYLLLEKDSPLPTSYLLKVRDVFAVSGDAITVKYAELAVNALSAPSGISDNDPAGAKAYTARGEYLGQVQPPELDDRYNVTRLTTDAGRDISPSLVATHNREIVIVQEEENPVSIARPTSRKVTVRPGNPAAVQQQVKLPDKAMINFEFLLGRKVLRDIAVSSGKVVVKRGVYITRAVLAEARRYGKLLELTKYSQI